MRLAISAFVLFLAVSCSNPKERDIASNRPTYNNHNWTGEYRFDDGENIHSLKLIRGRVDADYQVAYSTTENAFGGSIWQLKDHNDSIQLIFINNFTENAANVPFSRGDLIFSLVRDEKGVISTNWQVVQPTVEGSFSLIEK
jgi:hypothetical protein